jgi:hypothetical protein
MMGEGVSTVGYATGTILNLQNRGLKSTATFNSRSATGAKFHHPRDTFREKLCSFLHPLLPRLCCHPFKTLLNESFASRKNIFNYFDPTPLDVETLPDTVAPS